MMTRINAFIRVNSNKNMTEHLFQVDINLKYDGYIRRQKQQVAQFKKMLFLGNCNFILKWYNVSTKL